MPRRPEFKIVRQSDLPGKQWRLALARSISPSGKPMRLYFETRAEAEREADRIRRLTKNYGLAAANAPIGLIVDAQKSSAILEAHGISLVAGAEMLSQALNDLSAYEGVSIADAIAYYVQAHSERSVTFAALAEEWLTLKAKKRPAYRQSIKQALDRFLPVLGETKVSAINVRRLKEAFFGLRSADGKALTPHYWNLLRRTLSPMFAHAVSQGYADENPVSKLASMDTGDREIRILTLPQVQALVDAAEGIDLPYFALAIFTGVRPAELDRMSYENIHLANGYVDVAHVVSKTGQRRHVEIADNLKEMLKPILAGKPSTEPIGIGVRAFRRVRKAAVQLLKDRGMMKEFNGLKRWGHDIMRHTFASYWIAYHQDLDRLALQMGHTSTRTAFTHYLSLVTKEDAVAFWKITKLPAQAAESPTIETLKLATA